MAIDERSTIDKVSQGDFRSLDSSDAAFAGQLAAVPLLSSVAKSVPGGAAVSAGVSGIASIITTDKEAEILASKFSKRNLRELKRQNPALRRKINEMDERWEGDMIDAGVSTLGGAGVGALLGLVLGPIGSLVGSVIGGFIGHKIYSSALTKQAQDPVTMNLQVAKIAEEGNGVPAEAVFATLAANLSGKDGKMVGKILKKYTGTDLFAEALADPKNIPKLQAMMNNPVVDDAIRAQTGMPRDANDPMKSVAEQYAELINSGYMKPQNMLNTGEGLYVLQAISRRQGQSIDVPDLPGGRGHGLSR